jgi:large subunit ribosomal protein L32e
MFMSASGKSSSQQNSTSGGGNDLERLLSVRKEIKSRTPNFQRQESWRYVRIHEPWRKPKGVDSHMRLSVKGWPQLVKVGYRGPRGARYLHPSGLRDVLVHNVTELERLSPKTDAARLAGGLGRKKRIEIVSRARQLNIRVLNARGLLSAQKVAAEEREHEDEEKPSARASEAVSSKAAKEE